jgi:hypothetical protein
LVERLAPLFVLVDKGCEIGRIAAILVRITGIACYADQKLDGQNGGERTQLLVIKPQLLIVCIRHAGTRLLVYV